MNRGKHIKFLSGFGFVISTVIFLTLVWQERPMAEQEIWGQGFSAGLFAGFMIMWVLSFLMGQTIQDLEKDNS